MVVTHLVLLPSNGIQEAIDHGELGAHRHELATDAVKEAPLL